MKTTSILAGLGMVAALTMPARAQLLAHKDLSAEEAEAAAAAVRADRHGEGARWRAMRERMGLERKARTDGRAPAFSARRDALGSSD
jgi:hypothetical protein